MSLLLAGPILSSAGGGGGSMVPVELTTFNDTSFSATTFEGAQFTPTAGACVVIFIGFYDTDRSPRVTYGTQSRTFGTGTSLTPITNMSSGDPIIYVYTIPNAAASAITIQLDQCGTPRCTYIKVLEVTGAGATQTSPVTDLENGTSGTSESYSLASVTAGSVVIYCAQKQHRTETITWSGVDAQFAQQETGGTNEFQDFEYRVAYEVASGTVAATNSWTTSSNHQGIGIEVKA